MMFIRTASVMLLLFAVAANAAGVFPIGRSSFRSFRPTFGASRSGGSRCHAGVDLLTKRPGKGYAAYDGVVTRVAPFYRCRSGFPGPGYSHMVMIYHESIGKTINYGEINKSGQGIQVRVGQRVRAGQFLGIFGHCAMMHLELYQGRVSTNQRWRPPRGRRVGGGDDYCARNYRSSKPGALLDPRPLIRELTGKWPENGPRSGQDANQRAPAPSASQSRGNVETHGNCSGRGYTQYSCMKRSTCQAQGGRAVRYKCPRLPNNVQCCTGSGMSSFAVLPPRCTVYDQCPTHNMRNKADRDIECHHDGCTPELCCEPKVHCPADFACAAGTERKSHFGLVDCVGSECTQDECCVATSATDIDCFGKLEFTSAGCSVSCGTGVAMGTYRIVQDSKGQGKTCPYENGKSVEQVCSNAPCVQLCSDFTCPAGGMWTPKPDKATRRCVTTQCNADECCDHAEPKVPQDCVRITSRWTECSVTCGDGGTQSRTSEVTTPAENGGVCDDVPLSRTCQANVACPGATEPSPSKVVYCSDWTDMPKEEYEWKDDHDQIECEGGLGFCSTDLCCDMKPAPTCDSAWDPANCPVGTQGVDVPLAIVCPELSADRCDAKLCCRDDDDTALPVTLGIHSKAKGTCDDYIWNGDEEDIDCGGSCPACEYEFQPECSSYDCQDPANAQSPSVPAFMQKHVCPAHGCSDSVCCVMATQVSDDGEPIDPQTLIGGKGDGKGDGHADTKGDDQSLPMYIIIVVAALGAALCGALLFGCLMWSKASKASSNNLKQAAKFQPLPLDGVTQAS